MVAAPSFDIVLIGLDDASADGRRRFCEVASGLTGQPPAKLEALIRQGAAELAAGIDAETARELLSRLAAVGARVEIRPCAAPKEPALGDFFAEEPVATRECPTCGASQPADAEECDQCGAIFAKVELEQVREMQRRRQLEGAMSTAFKVREEWVEKAKGFLEKRPLPAGATSPFETMLSPGDVPFLRLESDEGPLLMTCLRLLALLEGDKISIPYELIADVDVGGGFLQKRGRVRLVLTLHAPLVLAGGPSASLAWQLDKESAFYKDVIMDWAFARSFVCGSCGERDLDFRLQGRTVHARCMHCATDHRVDLAEAIVVPLTDR